MVGPKRTVNPPASSRIGAIVPCVSGEPVGVDGEDGPDGLDGEDGEDGPDGLDGEDGLDEHGEQLLSNEFQLLHG